MDPTVQMTLGVLMRWVHIMSVIVLVGSAYYVRRARTGFARDFRSTVYVTKASYPPHYHMWFGIKVLLALHVPVALVLAAASAERIATSA